MNVSHDNIDIWDPVNLEGQPGFTDLEKLSFGKLLLDGFIDTFRHLYPKKQ